MDFRIYMTNLKKKMVISSIPKKGSSEHVFSGHVHVHQVASEPEKDVAGAHEPGSSKPEKEDMTGVHEPGSSGSETLYTCTRERRQKRATRSTAGFYREAISIALI